MAWIDVALPKPGALIKTNFKSYDWDALFKKVKNCTSIADIAGTNVSVSSACEGKKDEGKMIAGGYRLDIQSVNDGYVNWQMQSGKQSYACILTKCDTNYAWQDMVTQLELSTKNLKLRKDT